MIGPVTRDCIVDGGQPSRPAYLSAYSEFDMRRADTVLSRPLDAGLNAAYECCDRHVAGDRVALIWEDGAGRRANYTFARLQSMSAQFANFLTRQGIGPGDRVAALLPRTPELLMAILGTWRAGAVYQPLFTAFGPKAIEHRLQCSGAKLVITDAAHRNRIEGIPASIKIALITNQKGACAADFDLLAELEQEATEFVPVIRSADDPFLIMFTSGTTGPAKPLLVPLKALVAFVGYLRDAVDLRPEDRYWNIADPGWAYGLYYAVAAPLAMGHATHFHSAPFKADSAVEFIRRHGITSLAGAPTAFRMLIAAGSNTVRNIAGQLRTVSSAGEPLNPEVIRWFAEHLNVTIHDHYGQTELGMVVCNHHGLDHPVRLGAAGFSVPGHRAVVVDPEGEELPPGIAGTLAIDRGRSPLFWFSGYEGTATPSLGNRYYTSGDLVERNDDGSISFVGRADDVITSSGYRIGPNDVESTLIEHSAVAEAAVVGKPDIDRTEIVKAFVVLKAGFKPGAMLTRELQEHVRARLSAHAYPREIQFVESLPKTPSGKIQRFILREVKGSAVESDT